MSKHPNFESLRPIERRILTMKEEGSSVEEIASRLKKSPGFIERVIEWTRIPREGRRRTGTLSPLQSRILTLSSQGEDTESIARKFKRTERFIQQVEGLAHYRRGLDLIRDAAEQARAAERARA